MKLHCPQTSSPWLGPEGASENGLHNGGGKKHGLVSDLKRVDGVRQLRCLGTLGEW